MELPPEYAGPERRGPDLKLEAANQKLETAMGEVRHLYGAVEELAVAVSRSVPRDEIEARANEQKERERQFRDQARLIVIGFALLFLAIIIYSFLTVRGMNHRMDSGHQVLHNDNEVLLCVVRLPEATRTDLAVLGCRQATQVKAEP